MDSEKNPFSKPLVGRRGYVLGSKEWEATRRQDKPSKEHRSSIVVLVIVSLGIFIGLFFLTDRAEVSSNHLPSNTVLKFRGMNFGYIESRADRSLEMLSCGSRASGEIVCRSSSGRVVVEIATGGLRNTCREAYVYVDGSRIEMTNIEVKDEPNVVRAIAPLGSVRETNHLGGDFMLDRSSCL